MLNCLVAKQMSFKVILQHLPSVFLRTDIKSDLLRVHQTYRSSFRMPRTFAQADPPIQFACDLYKSSGLRPKEHQLRPDHLSFKTGEQHHLPSVMFMLVAVLSLAAFSNAGVFEHRSANPGISSPGNLYLPPSSAINTYSAQQTIRSQIPARQIAIVRQATENNGDGTFTFNYETEDGQTAEARGQLQADGSEGVQNTQGSYSFTGTDGVRYTVTYTAGVNGFEAQGAHLPVGPAIPEAIQKALADNAADEARGIFDDGTYREENTPAQRNSFGTTQVNYQQRTQFNQGVQTGYQQSGYQQSGYQQSGYQRSVPTRPFRI